MEQFDFNGPHGRGMIRIDPKTGKPIAAAAQVQKPSMADMLRSYSTGSKTHRAIEDQLK